MQDLYGLDSVAPKQMPLSYDAFEPALFSASFDLSYLYDPLPMETQLESTDIDGRTKICAIYSSSISPPPLPLPSPHIFTFQPPKWYEIPQRRYNRGRKQRGYTQSEPTLFQVVGFPGVNMGDALRGKFDGLENQSDLVLQDAKMAISCRILVRSSC